MDLAAAVDTCRGLLDSMPGGVTGSSIGLTDGHEIEVLVTGRCRPDGSPISEDTIWEAASLSKPLVALAALGRLGEPGLTGPLTVQPGAVGAQPDPRWAEITLGHLLTHTSGLPNWRSAGEQLRFEATPGSAGYSGEGYELVLAELCARTGTSSVDELGDLLRVLGMHRSSFVMDDPDSDDVALGTDEAGKVVPKSWPVEPRAAGSLHTSTGDYTRFLGAVLRGDPAGAALLVEPAIEHAPGHGRTLGWASTASDLGAVLWQHGDNPGFKHVAALRPSTNGAVVVFTNSDLGQNLYRDVCRRLFDVEVW